MDKNNRLSSSDEKQPKSSKEKSAKGKYYKHKKRPSQAKGISEEWLSRTGDDRLRSGDLHSGFWPPPHAQKLFPAMSDPAVCGYPVQFGYPFDQVALPIYPVIPATPVTQPFKTLLSYPDLKPRKKRQEIFQSANQKEAQYTSLPPDNGGECGSDQRRRFSDPGLANAQHSEDTCSSSSSSDNESNCGEQISNLISENERLTKEISVLRDELHSLKLEVNTVLDLQHSYPAGAVTDMIREVESALGMKEEALIAKTQQLVKEHLCSVASKKTTDVDLDKMPTKAEFEELKSKLAEVTLERDSLNKRVGHLEILIENFMQESKTKAYVSKVSSSLASEEKDKCDGANILSSLDTCESLSSSIGSGSLHSPLVTMSGPVTNV
ncbi:hypothetical protein AAG570_007765 [Ranatra chinensis]|uniref:Uncharacterized protein n=1 Tax=Ranatra chinensis TaxID=642074 RepID=A0ABD0XVS6_9HEMI